MTTSPREAPPTLEELDALLRLLDDETPEVRAQIARRLSDCSGDISEWLASRPRELSSTEKQVLVGLLEPARRKTLEREWVVPTVGAVALCEDWEAFEAILRSLSDFLHDGITIRQPLSDALDLLAEEAEENGIVSARDLRSFLFVDGRLAGNQADYDDPRNSDLAWAIAEGKSNPLGLCVIFTLVARRLGLVVEIVNFPGHLLCRIFEDGYPIIIDCFDRGQLHFQATLLESPDLSRSAKNIIQQAVDPGTVLMRLLNNLVAALDGVDRSDDAKLIRKLQATL